MVEVLDLISKQPNGVSVTEFSRLLKITKASASRLLASYVEAGLLERDAAQRHVLGLKLWSFGVRALQRFRIAEIARPIMKTTGVGLYLATIRGDEVVYIEQMGPGIAVTMPIATLLPIHVSGPGKAILAFSSEEFIEATLNKPMKVYTKQTIATKEALLADIAETRARGYSINRGEYEEQAGGIAVPVYDHTGRPVAAVGNALPPSELNEEYFERVVPIVMEAGSAISHALGYSHIGLKVG
jgi:DNA-binding IclR family transcriptional regulator